MKKTVIFLITMLFSFTLFSVFAQDDNKSKKEQKKEEREKERS